MDAAGPWKAVDGFEATARTHPPTPSHRPWKTGKRTPVSHSAHRPAATTTITNGYNGNLLRRSNQPRKGTSHVGDPWGECS
jgi:hypothetical protein